MTVQLSAQTPALSTVHHPLGSPAGPGLFRVKGLELPAYIQNIAHALLRGGHAKDESSAIQLAIGAVQRWARGGGKVSPEVRAAAAKALAEWAAARATAHAHSNARNDMDSVELAGAFNQALHPRVPAGGAGGGEFGSKAAGPAKQAPPKTAPKAAAKGKGKKTPAGKAAGSHATRPGSKPGSKPAPSAASAAKAKDLRKQARGLRVQASGLDAKAHELAVQSAAASKKAAAAAKATAAKGTTAKKNTVAKKKTATANKTTKTVSTKAKIVGLRTRADVLRMKADALDSRAKKLLLANELAGAVELAYRVPAGRLEGGQYADHGEVLSRHSTAGEMAAAINALDSRQRVAARRLMMPPIGFEWRGDRLWGPA